MSRSSRPAVLAALLGLAACGSTESGAETPAGEQGTTPDQPTPDDQATSAPPTGQPTPGQVTGEVTGEGAPSEPTSAPTTASRGSSAIDTATACPRARSCCAAFVDAIGEPVEAERARIACEQMDHLDELGEASGEACVAAIDGWRRALELAERDVPTACR